MSLARKEHTLTSQVCYSFALCLSPRNSTMPMKKLKAEFFGKCHFLWSFAETLM